MSSLGDVVVLPTPHQLVRGDPPTLTCSPPRWDGSRGACEHTDLVNWGVWYLNRYACGTTVEDRLEMAWELVARIERQWRKKARWKVA